MPDRRLGYTLTFRAPVGVFTGLGIAGLVDRTVVRDSGEVPFIPGSTVKGRLRFFAERLLLSGAVPAPLRFHGQDRPHCKSLSGACTLCRLFGNPSIPALVRVGEATLGEPWRSPVKALIDANRNPVVRPDVEIRPGIALSRQRRTVLPDHLFFDEAVPAGVRFEGTLVLDGTVLETERIFLVGVGTLVDALGARKAAGRGALDGGVCIQETAP
jgi:CRISPR/Cas system CSM-associated protein Csm3 (group 7 of RAMP superfamily)